MIVAGDRDAEIPQKFLPGRFVGVATWSPPPGIAPLGASILAWDYRKERRG